MPSAPRVVQVTNVAPATTKDQMKTLFGFLGRIDDLVIYPTSESANTTSKVCYVKFAYSEDVAVALHLTNTVFIDRALNVITVPDGRIPDEKTAMSSSYSQKLSDETKGDEVERTIYVANLDAAVAPETLMQFFGLHAGEVKYARMAGDEGLPVRAALIEFSEKTSVSRALALTGQLLGSRPVTVVPSNSAIVKSVSGLEGASSHEIEEALRKVNEAQSLISAAVDSDGSRRKRSRSRSRSGRRSRSRSRSRHRRSRSRSQRSRSHRSRSRKRSRSRSPRSRRRSKSRSPKQSSKDRRRHRSKSKSPKPSHSELSRSRSKGRKIRSDNDKGNSPHSERDGYSNSRKVSKDDRSQESSRYRSRSSRSSRSKSPVPYTGNASRKDKDKDRPRGSLDYDSRREQDLGSYHEGKRDKKSGDKHDYSDRKTSSKHRLRHDEHGRKSKRPTTYKAESDEDDNEVDEEERSAAEDSNDDEREEEAQSESDRSDDDREPTDEDTSHANLSRVDMDVESD